MLYEQSPKSPYYYNSIDGLRVLSCLGIILMHIQANTNYILQGNFVYDIFIPSLTWLVYLFLIISGFGISAGYLEKFKNKNIDLDNFYRKRYMRILPFFCFLIFIALIAEPNIATLYEASIEVLLLHGLLSNNAVSTLGVCWTLGVIFMFYLLFPAFSVLLKNKKRAWVGLLISLWIIFVCQQYFFGEYFVTESFTPRHSFVYCIPLFISGGLIYLYKEKVRNICVKSRWKIFGVCVIVTVFWYISPNYEMFFYIKSLILFSMWLFYAVGVESKVLTCKPMKFLSQISMEMYLAHMLIFRVVEKMHLLYIFGNCGFGGWCSFLFVYVLTVSGLIVFIQCYKIVYHFLKGYEFKG